MKVREKRAGNATVFSLGGMLDTRTVPSLQQRLARALAENPKIVLDLSDLKFISSAGVAAFILAAKNARARGGGLRLAGIHGEVQATFSVLRLDSNEPIWRLFPTVEEAVKDL